MRASGGDESFGRLQVDRDQPRNATFLHGNTEKAVHPGHRYRVMGDDDEPGFRAGTHLFEKAAEAIDVGVIQRGVHLVQHADGGGAGEEDGKDEGGGGQRLFAARHQRELAKALARRRGVDFEAGVERVFTFSEAQLGLAAAEQGVEQVLEVLIDDVEGGQQAFAAFRVQLLDARVQRADIYSRALAGGAPEFLQWSRLGP